MTPSQRLVEAERAYHELAIGVAVVEVTDQNGEKMRYVPANRGHLAAYIADLKTQVAGSTSRNGPMSIWGRS